MLSIFKRPTKEEDIISGLLSESSLRRTSEKKLYEHYFYLIKHGVRKYKLDEEECASVYSDTIISVIQNIVSRRFEGRASLKTFTYQIFMNKCVDAIRKKTTNKSTVNNATVDIDSLALQLPDAAQNIVQQIIRKSDHYFLMEKLRELGDKCRRILLLFEDGYSDKEIALDLGYNSPEVAKTSRMRCLERLREKIIAKKV